MNVVLLFAVSCIQTWTTLSLDSYCLGVSVEEATISRSSPLDST